ncbi:MAG: calcium-binding protein [Planctomycetaceae bacterium]|nr:calcium-binding protein [Planctomycetaceae bacterium]MCP4464524.1 calcium-binding protein [Planctomycetaceae bacterium]
MMNSVSKITILFLVVISLTCCQATKAQIRFTDTMEFAYPKPVRTVLIDGIDYVGGCKIEIFFHEANFLVVTREQSRWFPFYPGEHYEQQIIISGSHGDDDIDVYGTNPDIEDLSLGIYGLNGRDNIRINSDLPTFISGGAMDDRLYGGFAADRISGGPGNDIIEGRAGDDNLWGDAGDDYIWGHNGEDHLAGGPGADSLDGGADRDVLWGASPGGDILCSGWQNQVDFDNDRMTGGPAADLFHSAYYRYRAISLPFFPMPYAKKVYMERETIVDLTAEDTAKHHVVIFVTLLPL